MTAARLSPEQRKVSASPLPAASSPSGATVSLWDRDADLLVATVEQIGKSKTVSHEVVDVSDPQGVAVAGATIQKCGEIDILVANAVGWHTLRHSFGTLMKANGEDIKTIQELLRHATFKVTADTYTQAVTPVKRDAQARIAKLIMANSSASKAITPTLQ